MSEWTDEQHRVHAHWNQLKAQYVVHADVPRGAWPEENSEVVDVVDAPRRQYYHDLNEQYFSTPSIVLEIGAETRFSWSDGIDAKKHVVLRTTWSVREEHPSIWQIPVQELLGLLFSPEHGVIVEQLTHIIMENTLDCLPLEVVQRLFSFVERHNICLVALKYRPLSAPSMKDVQKGAGSHPSLQAPALALVAEELVSMLYAQQDARLHMLYVYRPPMGEPIAVPIALENTEEDKRRFYALLQEKERSNGAVKICIRPLGARKESDLQDLCRQVFDILWAVQDRPQSKYRVHMILEPMEPQYTLVHLWFVRLARMTSTNRIHMYMDSTCAEGDVLVHTWDGALIDAQGFIAEWKAKGVSEDVLKQYAYGQIGEITSIPFAIERTMPSDLSSCIFQVVRIELGEKRGV